MYNLVARQKKKITLKADITRLPVIKTLRGMKFERFRSLQLRLGPRPVPLETVLSIIMQNHKEVCNKTTFSLPRHNVLVGSSLRIRETQMSEGSLAAQSWVFSLITTGGKNQLWLESSSIRFGNKGSCHSVISITSTGYLGTLYIYYVL